MIILGAGLSGLICGTLNAQSSIFERNHSDFVSHRAVLRFRDDKIARALGLAFRKVTVRKSIWLNNREVSPSPRIANWYSRKVRGVITENSIWNIAPSERYIAPDDLHSILADLCGDRVRWGTEISRPMLNELLATSTVVSTMPLPVLLKLLDKDVSLKFDYQPITVHRFHVLNCDVHQTVYFPHPENGVYRATLTGDLLTIESSGGHERFHEVLESMGLRGDDLKVHETPHKQSYGKIAPIPNGDRKALLHRLTQEFGIYSLGRFATWRNILLDDVYDDIAAIRRMVNLSQYDHQLERAK